MKNYLEIAGIENGLLLKLNNAQLTLMPENEHFTGVIGIKAQCYVESSTLKGQANIDIKFNAPEGAIPYGALFNTEKLMEAISSLEFIKSTGDLDFNEFFCHGIPKQKEKETE